MPSTLKLKKVCEFLDVQIAEAKREEREAEEAHLQAEEEAQVATKKARREEEECKQEHVWEQECLAEEAWVRAEEEEWVAVEHSRRAGGGHRSCL